MGEAAFRVTFAADAWGDLVELTDYWASRGEAWRAEKYTRDLVHHAKVELSNPVSARHGRRCKSQRYPDSREILAFGVYRLIYDIDEESGTVTLLRFWHAHRDEPGREA